MSSAAYQAYERNRIDVVRLIESHGRLHNGTPGKKGLGHITRSGVVMLCAAWELYAESLAIEGVIWLCAQCEDPSQLPIGVQRELAKYVRESKHELKPLALANSGWREVLTDHVKDVCAKLNTPKAGPLADLFQTFLGLPKLTDAWSCDVKTLNQFVGVRGDIAHRGRNASYVTLTRLKDFLTQIDTLAKESDNAVREHLRQISPLRRQPWQKIT